MLNRLYMLLCSHYQNRYLTTAVRMCYERAASFDGKTGILTYSLFNWASPMSHDQRALTRGICVATNMLLFVIYLCYYFDR